MFRISRLHPKKAIVVGALTLVLTGIILGGIALAVEPTVTFASLGNNQALGLADDLELDFSLPTSRRDLAYQLSPAIDGSWQWQGGIGGGHLARRLTFSPEGFWEPSQTYTVTVTGIGSPLSDEQTGSWSGQFRTLGMPTIVSAASISSDTPVDPAATITVTLDQANDSIADFSFLMEPAAELDVVLTADKTAYLIRPKEPLGVGVGYTLIAKRQVLAISKATQAIAQRGVEEEVWRQSFQTVAPPTVATFEPQGEDVLPNPSAITVTFQEPMEATAIGQAVELRPPVSGSWRWESDRKLSFAPSEGLAIATNYEIILGTSLKTSAGVGLDEPIHLAFKTVGEVTARSYSPAKSGIAANTAITVTFNQPVDHASAESRWSLSPSVEGQFSWSDNRLTFQPASALGYYQTYTVSIGPGVKAIYGRDSTKPISFKFTTAEKLVLLNVRFDRQDRALSCEAAALKMALRYRGVNVGETDIMEVVGYDSTPRGSGTWGDPDIAFVGSIDGGQNTTGYGVHWDPIARAARTWRPAEAFSGWSVQDLAAQIEAGNPVVVWGVTGVAYADPWQTPSGRTINAWKGEHARTVIGWRGSVDNPSSFIINDPLAGRVTWSVSRFQADWAKFNNSGVVVY